MTGPWINTWNDVRNFMDSGEPLNSVPTGMDVIPVVGLTFIPGYPGNVLAFQQLVYDEIEVVLVRRPDNKYDNNAIEVHANGEMLGHLPAAVASYYAPKLDEGIEHEAFIFGIRISPDNPSMPGIDLVVGVKK